MNIFLINHYAGSPEMGMEYRPYYLAQEWIKQGHKVTILAATFSHLRKNNPEQDKDIIEEQKDGIQYIWIKTPPYEGNGVGRIKNMFTFIQKTLFKASYFAKNYQPDVVIASSTYPSDNYIARKISKLAKAKYIFEVHDLWPLSPMELGNMSKYHPFIATMQHGEDFAYRKANAVVSMLPKTKEHMAARGLSLDKWHYIPNGIVIEDWESSEPLKETHLKQLSELKTKNKTIIGYTGGHAISNSLDTIIETARLLKDNSKIHFVLIGNGTEKQKLIEQAKELNNISFLDSIPKNQIPSALELMDILLITWNKSPLYRFGISPNKIFDYMMAKKPIIHASDAPNTFVEEANCGISVEPENPNLIKEAILKLQKTSITDLQKMGKNGKEFILKNHDYKVLSKKFIDIIESI